MSLADLTVPNSYNIQCGTLTADVENINTLNTLTVNATGPLNQITLNSGTHKTIINCPGVVGSTQTLAIPDSGLTNSSFILSDNVTGSNTINVPINLTKITNQLVLGNSSHKTIINSTAPAGASQTLTIPDTGVSSAQFIMSDSSDGVNPPNQTINQSLNFTSGNPIIFGSQGVNVAKTSRISAFDYGGTNKMICFSALTNNGQNALLLGGGSGGSLNACTEMDFYAAATTGVSSGTQMMQLTTSGLALQNGAFTQTTTGLSNGFSSNVTFSSASGNAINQSSSTAGVNLAGATTLGNQSNRFSFDDQFLSFATSANTNVVRKSRLRNVVFAGTNHYTFVKAYCPDANNNNVEIGGSITDSDLASTQISLYAAANASTANGTKICHVDINGLTIDAGGRKGRAISLISNTNLDLTHSENIIQLTTQVAGVYTLILPLESSSAAFKYRFSVIARTNANNIIISTTAAANTLNGTSIMSGATLAVQVAKHQITLTQANLSVGDFIELVCDGTSWNMQCVSTNAGAAFVFA